MMEYRQGLGPSLIIRELIAPPRRLRPQKAVSLRSFYGFNLSAPIYATTGERPAPILASLAAAFKRRFLFAFLFSNRLSNRLEEGDAYTAVSTCSVSGRLASAFTL